MSWDDTKTANDDFTSSDYNDLITALKLRSTVSSGAGAPTSTPSNLGDIYVDTTNIKLYFASGTSAASDWKKVMSQ